MDVVAMYSGLISHIDTSDEEETVSEQERDLESESD